MQLLSSDFDSPEMLSFIFPENKRGMKAYPSQGSYTQGENAAQALVLPSQTCRRRSLPRLPELHLNSDSLPGASNLIPGGEYHAEQHQHNPHHVNYHSQKQPWEGGKQQQQQQQAPHRPPRPSLQLQLKSPEFADQFDAFLYKSQHIATPSRAPELQLEIPSEESSRRPSNCSALSSASPFVTNPHHQQSFLFPTQPDRLLHRRNSHAGNLGQVPQPRQPPSPGQQQQAFLNVPRGRTRGSSLPDTINSSELYRLRNFATHGKKVINKGDSFRSRNSSINSSRSR